MPRGFSNSIDNNEVDVVDMPNDVDFTVGDVRAQKASEVAIVVKTTETRNGLNETMVTSFTILFFFFCCVKKKGELFGYSVLLLFVRYSVESRWSAD